MELYRSVRNVQEQRETKIGIDRKEYKISLFCVKQEQSVLHTQLSPTPEHHRLS